MEFTKEELLKVINDRIGLAKSDIENAQSDAQYERAKGALYELEDLLNELKLNKK